ncbi:MAG: (Fe-S)-binding protein [Gammaproteobacteria bacterium]|nr:(Fe-S)-binding protein [Gammaproteobacteria bacterium]MCP4881728.1 (Fe-S)-binding protein [Gammaproteobacteria bacterium]MDP6166246.1 (Fe-S)-binding protein [Gammaproteobacteria bacterium]
MSVSPYLQAPEHPPKQPRVALFITCLVDAMRPSVAFATIKLLEAAGCQVSVPELQTCCGQPAYNSGAKLDTQKIARQNLKKFADYDFVVGPSGSCIGMLHQYPDLFAPGSTDHQQAENLARKAWEATSFLTDVMQFQMPTTQQSIKVTYHDSCAGLRELGVQQQPRQLLAQVAGLEINEMAEADTCCGFGGTFCIKFPDISNRMVSNKAENAEQSGAQMLLGGDLGCLMNMAGKLKRQESTLQTRHVLELLADMLEEPAIGEAPGTPLRAPDTQLGYEV